MLFNDAKLDEGVDFLLLKVEEQKGRGGSNRIDWILTPDAANGFIAKMK